LARFAEVVFNLPINRSFLYSIDDAEGQKAQVGCRARAPFRSRILTGVIVNLLPSAPSSLKKILPLKKIIDHHPAYNDELLRLGGWMADYYCCALGEALSAMIPNVHSQHTKEEVDIAVPLTVPLDGPPLDGPPLAAPLTPPLDAPLTPPLAVPLASPLAPPLAAPRTNQECALNKEQERAMDTIIHSDKGLLYLYGITGSGKSELLLHIARHEAAQKRNILLLVPEISLALQTAEYLSARYGMEYAILHSRMPNKERVRQWMRAMRGEAHIVIGARSAIFAPLPTIDMIIMDEEQDGAYKSSFTPRYHTRHIAMHRARAHKAKVLFASATPSLEAWYHIQSGRIQKVSLPTRIAGAKEPTIEIVPLNKERKIISAPLEDAIVHTIAAQKQVILLHNRRGYGRTLTCKSCGYTQLCPHCSVAMIYHHGKGMLCHYCATTQEKKTICPECQSLEINFASFGTERVEEEARRLFPDFRIARIDLDTTRKRESLSALLSAFRAHEIDIIVGTQIIAKGLNFKDVELIGIISADTSLMLPDFRAEEHTFALLTQVAGRAGRFSEEGRVLIQTYRTDNDAIQAVQRHDVESYYRQELEKRLQLSFPPYFRMIRLVIRSPEERNAEAHAEALHTRIRASQPTPAQVYGPIPCAIAKIADHYRYQIVVSDTKFAVAHRAVATALHQMPPKPTTYIEVDIDPTRVL